MMRLKIVAILSLLEVCRAYSPAANPPMLTHASMDVGNIISIVIPESPDENINIEQLTGEFRQQLERIKKQSRASKVEHGLVTLKRVLPEMSREEKRKTLPLIRRVLHGRRLANSGSIRNRTREALQLEQMRESRQLVTSHLADNPEEARIYRDYEEAGNREPIAVRIDQSIVDKDNYRRFNDKTYGNRREEPPREDPINRSEQIRQEQLIQHEESGHRENRLFYPDDDPSALKISRSRSAQEWNGQNSEEQSRADTQTYPEMSTVDSNYKSDRVVRQKQPGYEINENDRYGKFARVTDVQADIPEEPNVDCTKLDQRMIPKEPSSRQDSVDDMKRSLKDARAFEISNIPAYVRREYGVSGASNPECDGIKANGSGEFLKNHETNRNTGFGKRHQEALILEREGYKASRRIIQDPREQSESPNVSGFKNVVSEGVDDDYTKKNNDHDHSEDFGEHASINPSLRSTVNRWSVPTYKNRDSTNSSDGIKSPLNVYEMYGEKDIAPGLTYAQREQDSLRAYLDNEPKIAAAQQFANDGVGGRVLRLQRATNRTYHKNHSSEPPKYRTQQSTSNDRGPPMTENVFERLKHFLEARSLPKIIYNSVILLTVNESRTQDGRTREASTEAEKSESTFFPSMAEPTSSTRHEVPVTRSKTDPSQIETTDDPVPKSNAAMKL